MVMTRTTKRRVAFWGTVGVALAASLVVMTRPQPVPVDFAAVSRGPMAETLDHEGRTRVRERYVVSAPVAGRVLRIELRPGDRVVANQTVIATFAPGVSSLLDARSRAGATARVSEAEALLEQAGAQRELARVQSRHAKEERDRAQNLAKFGLLTAEGLQAAETQAAGSERSLEAAEAAVRAAAHEVEAARAMLVEPGSAPVGTSGTAAKGVTLTLRSPIDGVVLERHRESETVVMQGEPLVTVADTSALEVVADFLSSDAVRIQPGMRAFIDQWGGGQPLGAVVRRVEPAGFLKISALGVEEQRVWVVLDLEGPASAGRALGDGYRVEVRVVIWEGSDVTRVPVSSLFRRGTGWAVFVEEGGLARERPVQIGHRNGTFAEVLSGVSVGAKIIVYPPDTVSDGTHIAAR
jgi:HlyD family secretion protein